MFDSPDNTPTKIIQRLKDIRAKLAYLEGDEDMGIVDHGQGPQQSIESATLLFRDVPWLLSLIDDLLKTTKQPPR